MSFSNNSSTIFVLIILATTSNVTSLISAADINITNNCPYTVWAAAVPGGGRQLLQGQNWMLNSDPNFHDVGRIWGRTNCDFTRTTAKKCDSGDCNGALLCDTSPQPPATLAEYTFGTGIDFLDISLLGGFNVPIGFSIPEGVNCSWKRHGPSCSGDMINEICPTELRDVGGCLHPCTVFENDQFCCLKGPSSCDSKEAYFKFFKDACPEAYTYPYDDSATIFTCQSAKNYNVVFCPTYE
ncbi:hypothetical protein ACFE04_000232 [Oxalis oulophora]